MFEQRAQESDRRFTEAGYRGRRTDRGVLFVLHGEPAEIDYEINPLAEGPPLEVWSYPADAPVGLDGRRPRPRYSFYKPGDLTVLFPRHEVDRLRDAIPPQL